MGLGKVKIVSDPRPVAMLSAHAKISHANTTSNISQEKYDQLIGLLQQVNILPSANPSNNVSISSMILDPSPAATSLGIICTTSNSLSHAQYWILDFGANDHMCSLLHFFHFRS